MYPLKIYAMYKAEYSDTYKRIFFPKKPVSLQKKAVSIAGTQYKYI